MRAVVVALDGVPENGGAFAALAEPRGWNGWLIPWFSRVEVERMAADRRVFVLEGSDAPVLRFVGPDARALLEGTADDGTDGGVYWRTVERRVFSDGVERFCVGDGWIWAEVEPLEGDDDDAAGGAL